MVGAGAGMINDRVAGAAAQEPARVAAKKNGMPDLAGMPSRLCAGSVPAKIAQAVAVSVSSNTSLTLSSSSRSMVTLPPLTRRPNSSSSASAERIVS